MGNTNNGKIHEIIINCTVGVGYCWMEKVIMSFLFMMIKKYILQFTKNIQNKQQKFDQQYLRTSVRNQRTFFQSFLN